MNISLFNASLTETHKLLKKIDILKMKGIKSISKNGVSEEFKQSSRNDSYFLLYNVALKNFDFDFLLKDQSFIQFTYQETSRSSIPLIRYSYYQNPQKYITYEEYLEINRQQGFISESNIEIGDLFISEYHQFLIEQELISNFTTIRYDVDSTNYQPLVHSVSHIHIGYINNIRIPCNKIITPLTFMLFILRHVYYSTWKNIIETQFDYLNSYLDMSNSWNAPLQTAYWQDLETKDLYIS